MNSSLTNAALAFHFISGGTDAPERSLQILTGPRRTRARKRHTLIGIFREEEEEEEKNVTMDKDTLCSSNIMDGFYEEGCQFF